MKMKKILFLMISFVIFSSSLKAEKAIIEFVTVPPMNEILPDKEMAKLKFSIKNKKGELLKNALVRIKLKAPATEGFFSTDFPVVEGSELIDVNMLAVNGTVEIDYLLPIRGIYDLEVTAKSDTEAFDSSSVKPLLILNEVPAEVTNFYTLIAILLVFGLLAGFVLAKSIKANSKEAVGEK